MSKPCLGSSLSISPDSGFGSPSSAIFLLHVVDGVGGGRLQGIPWHGLPLIRAFIKERLALSVISSCQCCYPSASWDDNQADTSTLRLDRQERVLGCPCSRWRKDALGTLSCSDKTWGLDLQKEIINLGSEIALQQEIADTAVSSLHIQFSRIAISSDFGRMAHNGNNPGLQDIMKNLRRLYEMTAIGVMDNKEMAKEIKSMSETVSRTSLEVSNNGARTDDLESNLLELLGRVERIEEDLKKLVSMNEESRVNGVNEAADQPMEEESVFQPRPQKGT